MTSRNAGSHFVVLAMLPCSTATRDRRPRGQQGRGCHPRSTPGRGETHYHHDGRRTRPPPRLSIGDDERSGRRGRRQQARTGRPPARWRSARWVALSLAVAEQRQEIHPTRIGDPTRLTLQIRRYEQDGRDDPKKPEGEPGSRQTPQGKARDRQQEAPRRIPQWAWPAPRSWSSSRRASRACQRSTPRRSAGRA
jgi:hypothetical protein